MCGIAGVWGTNDQSLVQQMMHKLAHRGPDGSGLHNEADHGTLGHCRLAIMDPVGGAQPIYNEQHSLAIVANGEIYNFPTLRPALTDHHQFRTTSDSEAVLHLFEESQQAVVQGLQGMFAFAICQGDRLFLARDPIGIKPLYYGQRHLGDEKYQLLFASELKALADWADSAYEFPPGNYYDSQQGLTPYYQVPTAEPIDRPVTEQIKIVRAALEKAVASHLMSDVPVGAFLSGGLDSSVIAALARRHVRELHTFSVGVDGSDDIVAARRVAEHIGSIHHEYLFTAEEVRQLLPEIIYYLESFDQDLVRSAIPCYFCSRLAAQEVKVILTGEGADELFAGYTYHRQIQNPAVLHKELCRSVSTLHNINLQRVDRLTMRHGLEGRVPFLDTEFIEVALQIPAESKLLTGADGKQIEKWVLRQACADLLPEDILWRSKAQFDEGSGTVDLLQEALRPELARFAQQKTAQESPLPLRSSEEKFYHHLLVSGYSRPQPVLSNVARWTENRHSELSH